MPRAGQIARAITAIAALMALIVGVPAILWWLAGNPLPQQAPSISDITDALTRPDDGRLFLGALTIAGWITWVSFVVAVAAEIPAQLRGRRTARLPLLGPQQRLAAGLVAAVALLAASPTIASASTTPVYAATPSQAPAAVAVSAPRLTPPTADYIVHRVQPGETTASITRLYTGDPARFQQILAPNIGRAQPGGQALREGQVSVKAGWTLHIPADVVTTTVYEVERGDWLTYIAERFHGDKNAYPDLQRLNPELKQRDGRFPDHIEKTWRIRVGATVNDRGPREHATGRIVAAPRKASTPAPNTPPSGGGAAVSSTPPAAGVSPSSSASPAPAPAATNAAPATPAATPTQRPAAADGHQPAEDGSMLDQALLVGVPLIGAGLLAALLLTTLRRRRRRQQHHRPVGRRLPEPVSPQVEMQMRVVAQPIAVDRLDQALRVLAAALVDRPAEQMPDIVGAWLAGDTVNLLLTGACPNPPAPWVGDQRNWSLPGDVPLPDVDGQLAPLPTLVAVGSRPGMHLLVDLERLGLLTITGDPSRAGDLLRYFAAELACNTWSDHVEITVAGFDAAETGELIALGGDRIDAAPSVAVAVERIRRRASQVVQSLDHLGAGDPLTGRVADIAADAWMPHVLLAHNPNPDEIAALETLDNDLTATGRCAVAVAVTARQEIGRWPVSIDPAGVLSVDFLGMTGADASLTAAGLPRPELANLAQLLDTARRGTPETPRPGAPATAGSDEDWPPVPPAAETESWAQGTDAAGSLLRDSLDAEQDEHDPTDDEAPADLDDTAPAAQTTDPTTVATAVPLPAPDESGRADDEVTRIPAVIALPGRQAVARNRVTTPVRRRHSDPSLDADIRAWSDGDPNDPTRPRIAILGPVTVEAGGQLPSERLRFYAEIVTFLAARGKRGVTTEQFDEAMWPGQQVKATSRRVAVARARSWLGNTPDGEPWLPDATADRSYRLREGYLLDWWLFRRLRARGESRGPAGANDLRQALALVRGVPLAGADVAYSAVARNPYPWLPKSDIQPYHLASGVVDTAHRLVELCLEGGDIATARWAVDQAWLADTERASDIAWRDLLRVADAEGNTAELEQLLDGLMQARDAEVPEDLDKATYGLLCDLMPDRMRAGVR
ncbi:MAG: hypothetical protein V7603_5091 [Micromonosporaceae bacterium]